MGWELFLKSDLTCRTVSASIPGEDTTACNLTDPLSPRPFQCVYLIHASLCVWIGCCDSLFLVFNMHASI